MPEIMNEAPDSRSWFQSDPSRTLFKTSSQTMHVQGIDSDSPVYPPHLQTPTFGSIAIEGGSQHGGNVGVDSDQESRIDEDRVDEDGMDDDRVDEGGNSGMVHGIGEDLAGNCEGDLENGGNNAKGLANSVDRHGGEREPDTQRHDGAENEGTVGNNLQPSKNSAAHSARRGVEGNDREEKNVQGQSSVAGENNGEEDDAMEGGSIAGKDVEGNDGERDDIEMDMGRRASVAEDDVEGNGGVEDSVGGRDNDLGEDFEENGEKDYDMDALSSIAEEDDDDGDCGKAEKGREPKKEEKPPVKNPNRDRTKGWNDKAGLRKETAIDVDAFFVSSPLIGLNWFLNSSLLACRRNYLRT